MYRFDGEIAIETWQITHDDFLKSGRFLGNSDTRLMRYASRRIGEDLYRLSCQRLVKALVWDVGDDVEAFLIEPLLSTICTGIYQETGLLFLDVIIADRYDFNKRRF